MLGSLICGGKISCEDCKWHNQKSIRRVNITCRRLPTIKRLLIITFKRHTFTMLVSTTTLRSTLPRLMSTAGMATNTPRLPTAIRTNSGRGGGGHGRLPRFLPALIFMLHHPVYSFDVYNSGRAKMADVLENAIRDTGRVPNLVMSGHVRDYQR